MHASKFVAQRTWCLQAGKRAARDKQKDSGIKARKKTRKKHKKATKQKDEKKDRKRQRCAPLMLTPQATNEALREVSTARCVS